MRTIKNINTFAIALPFIIFLSTCIFGEGAIIFALLSTMITGLLQVLLGIKMLVDNPKARNLQIYISAVVLFFGLWFVNKLTGYHDFLSYILVPIPLILAIYLSIIIYKN
ncbi:hypothetical protein [Flavobacterium daemonense]|uniref:hypothetical protein n=1 Tax=Flavobacterium daemonense TaxID=1393049 RepID=UPI001186114D|nr:hypothetical protein [Flavobacterium daemonense]KAF2333234.1 hypothetical protein FND99_11405 [Flavobacterium daemonense]